MRHRNIEVLDDDLDDLPIVTRSELGLPVDLAREDLDEEDDLGFRALYEHPESVLRSAGWPDAACA